MQRAVTEPEYAIRQPGNPRSAAARLKALSHAGPLLLAKEHVLTVIIPDAFHHASATERETTLHLMHDLIVPYVIFPDDAAKNAIHLAVKLARLAVFWQDMDAAGLDKTPIRGDLTKVYPALARRIRDGMAMLTTAQRTINMDDMEWDGEPDNPQTDTWFDWVTIGALSSGGHGAPMVAQMMSLSVMCIYSGDDGGRGDDAFTGRLKHMLSSTGRSLDDAPSDAQAAAVIKWIKLTKPPPRYVVHVDPTNVAEEIERRAGATQAERFEPLFQIQWREASAQQALV